MTPDSGASDSGELRFHWSDYLVFIVSLVASGSVGVIQGIIDHVRTRNSKKEDAKVGGERNISVWPASLSVMASTLAAPFVLGVPAEMYAYGTQFSVMVVGYMIGIPLCTHLFYSRFYDMGITSIYEYLEFRFNRTIRSLCTFIFAFSIIIYMGIITYAPAIAFSQVTGLSLQISVLGVGFIGILYTTVGGLKGVIWVDAIQMLITIAGILAVIIKGTIDVGGMGEVWRKASEGNRIHFTDFSLDPTVRHTVWTQSIGGIFAIFVIFTNQSIVQKFLGLPTKKKMFITSYASLVAICSYLLMSCLAGVVMFAYYADCSPLELAGGTVKKFDQLLPVFVLKIFKGVYGVPGLFTASVFSASLSSLAGGINALAAVTILDVINPLYAKYSKQKTFTQCTLILIFKSLVFGYGLVTIGCAYLAPLLGEGLLQLALNLMGVVGTPMFALFLMGIYMPCINALGAGVGLMASLLVMLWIAAGGLFTIGKYKLHIRAMLPYTRCPNMTTAGSYTLGTPSSPSFMSDIGQNVSDIVTTTGDIVTTAAQQTTANLTMPLGDPTGIEKLYTISYMWYYVVALVVAIVVAFLVSWCTGFRKGEPIDLTLSVRCCYKDVKEQLVDDEGYTGYPEKSPLNGSRINPAFTPPICPSGGAPGAGKEGEELFGEYDDSGVYGYGIIARDRCSRCRKSRIVHCTRF